MADYSFSYIPGANTQRGPDIDITCTCYCIIRTYTQSEHVPKQGYDYLTSGKLCEIHFPCYAKMCLKHQNDC